MAIQTTKMSNVRYKFSGGWQGRTASTNKDQRFINVFPEKVDDSRTLLVKRPGLDTYLETDAGEGRGIFHYNNYIWSVIGNKLYRNNTYTGTTLGTSTGVVGFTECTEEGLPRLFLCDGTDGYIINTSSVITKIPTTYTAWAATTTYSLGTKRRPTVANTIYYEVTTAGTSNGTEPTWPTTLGTTVTDGTVVWTARGYYGGFPSPHTPTPVYLDGYVCLAHADSADIYNCDLENPYGWSASNYITSELFPDEVVALARQNNLVVAFGQTGTEFFYDNGANQPTGTPLAKYTSAFLQMGSCAPYAVGQNERYCFYISQSQSGGRAAWMLDGVQPTKISDEAIGRALDAEGDAIINTTGYLLRLVGHFFWVICLTERTLVFDIEEKVWHEWSSTSVVNFTQSQINGSVINTLSINGSASGNTLYNTTAWVWRFASDIGNGDVYFLHESSGDIAKSNYLSYKDAGQLIRCEIQTPIIDFGSYKRKFIHRLSIVSDLATNYIFVRWSDDDYRTWSNSKALDMNSRPVLHRLGATRRRAFNIYYTDDYPLRIEALDIIVEEGET